jgi:hypothetical protein
MTGVFPTSMVLYVDLPPSPIHLPANPIQPHWAHLGCDETHNAAGGPLPLRLLLPGGANQFPGGSHTR